jgi:hypothetical protein
MHPKKDADSGPWKEEQSADCNIDGQLKVGPIHQGTAGVPATNGESWTLSFLYTVRYKTHQSHASLVGI